LNTPANVLYPPNTIRPFIGLKTAEDAYKEPDSPPVLKRNECIQEHIEKLDAHLLKALGMAKTPLTYVT
jgi:hypothetical protein